ncbi:MAG TPA: GyrI-like domain-containing protein [Devosia sp.]|jgi:hypothetical protein|uniref:GyrI-like domain-containing protein n=1 Tax=Devosia sp. TaxID=1871048 RepID=UPI002F94D916
MDIIKPPAVENRSSLYTLGISETIPFRGMISARDRLWAELIVWLDQGNIPHAGLLYLRLNVVNMAGGMDVEAGVITALSLPGEGRIRSGVIPGGMYATLTHRNHSVRANKLLLDWVDTHKIRLDRKVELSGERSGCRYEQVLTDVTNEPRRTNWLVQLNVLMVSD